MGVFKPSVTTRSITRKLLLIFTIIISSFLQPSYSSIPTQNTTLGNNGTHISMGSPSSSPPFYPKRKFSPFRPSIAVIVAVLTTIFSITFLLLLYTKHCKRGSFIILTYGSQYPSSRMAPPSFIRKHSGIDRNVIESLPVFRFGSLRDQKDGLECAVCLNRFKPREVLRLLPKCKHAFHVECVDTWLDAHSSCPLCRYRVDPEDIILVEETKILNSNQPFTENDVVPDIENGINSDESNSGFRRVLRRHSSALEQRATGSLQIVFQRTSLSGSNETATFRRSLDSWKLKQQQKNSEPSMTVGCFDRSRTDGLLLTQERESSLILNRRLEHKIIVSTEATGVHQRWSDIQPSDLLYLRSEMIVTYNRRYSLAPRSGSSEMHNQKQSVKLPLQSIKYGQKDKSSSNCYIGSSSNGRNVINSRSVSEITGLNRFENRDSNNENQIQRQARLVSRWLAWRRSDGNTVTEVK